MWGLGGPGYCYRDNANERMFAISLRPMNFVVCQLCCLMCVDTTVQCGGSLPTILVVQVQRSNRFGVCVWTITF